MWLFTFVGASRGHLCDSTAFLIALTAREKCSVQLSDDEGLAVGSARPCGHSRRKSNSELSVEYVHAVTTTTMASFDAELDALVHFLKPNSNHGVFT